MIEDLEEAKNLLLLGVDLPALAHSARRAGYNVYAVDYFGDMDLRSACVECLSTIRQEPGRTCGRFSSDFDPEGLVDRAKRLVEKVDVDGVLLSSGLDDEYDLLCRVESEVAPIIGNKPETFRAVRDRRNFFQELRRLGIPHPETFVVEEVSEAESAAKGLGFPVLVKPAKGFAGVGVRRVDNVSELRSAFREVQTVSEKVVVQQYVEGIHASVSVMASRWGVAVLTVNEQLLGMAEVGQREPFGYCGNVVPLEGYETVLGECAAVAEKLCRRFGLLGSNGIDVVLSDGKPYVVEVNPRFQATLECVERLLGVNLVEAHVKACTSGELPEVGEPSGFCTRLILYARRRVAVPDLTCFGCVRDVPYPGVLVEAGEPICSVVVFGEDRSSSLEAALKMTEKVYGILREA